MSAFPVSSAHMSWMTPYDPIRPAAAASVNATNRLTAPGCQPTVLKSLTTQTLTAVSPLPGQPSQYINVPLSMVMDPNGWAVPPFAGRGVNAIEPDNSSRGEQHRIALSGWNVKNLGPDVNIALGVRIDAKPNQDMGYFSMGSRLVSSGQTFVFPTYDQFVLGSNSTPPFRDTIWVQLQITPTNWDSKALYKVQVQPGATFSISPVC